MARRAVHLGAERGTNAGHTRGLIVNNVGLLTGCPFQAVPLQSLVAHELRRFFGERGRNDVHLHGPPW